MKRKIFGGFFLSFFIIFFASNTFGASNEKVPTPIAFVPESRYTFEPVMDGVDVLHDFIIQNKGNALLKIEQVKPG